MMYGVEVIRHDFNDLHSKSLLTLNGPTNTIGTVNDGTIYTCNGTNASFVLAGGVICIKLPNNKNFIVSPAKAGLNEIFVYYTANNNSINIYISTDGSEWTLLEGNEYISKNYGYVRAMNLNGDYQVKVVNKTGGDAYIQQMNYYSTPCRCLRVVVSE
jgi:hypothetical protein